MAIHASEMLGTFGWNLINYYGEKPKGADASVMATGWGAKLDGETPEATVRSRFQVTFVKRLVPLGIC